MIFVGRHESEAETADVRDVEDDEGDIPTMTTAVKRDQDRARKG